MRVTSADVTSHTGWSLPQATEALKAAAAEQGGAIEVTNLGHMIFVFPLATLHSLASPSNPTSPHLSKSFRSRLSTSFKRLVGLPLLCSLALLRPLRREVEGIPPISLWGELRALLAPPALSDPSPASPPTSPSPHSSPPLAPRSSSSSSRSHAATPPLPASLSPPPSPSTPPSLALACASFLLGEGFARTNGSEAQWRGMASVIRANKGAVCAEQLYPHLLDARPAKEALALLLPASFELGEEKWGGRGGAKQGLRGGARTEDRAEAGQGRRQERRIWGGWKVRGRGEDAGLSEGMQGIAPLLVDEALLPALAHLDGTPEPTEGGDVIYRFPDLLPTSTIDRSYGRYPRPLVRGAGNVVRAISGPQPGVDFLEEPLLPFMESGDARVVRPAAHLLLSLARSPFRYTTRNH